MKNQNNTEQSVGKQSFLKRKNVEISFKRYAIDAMGAMALGLFASLLLFQSAPQQSAQQLVLVAVPFLQAF